MAGAGGCTLPYLQIPRDVLGVLGLLYILMMIVMISMGDPAGLVMLGIYIYAAWQLWKKIRGDD